MKAILVFTFLFSSFIFAKNIAKVSMLRGEAFYTLEDKKNIPLYKGDWLKEGAVVKTSSKSFVRLKFIDDSKVNVGPKSVVKVEQFKDDKPGVLNIVKGKIRAEVSKDYLKIKKNKSKLFVRSNDAVMGIRGTDFVFSANKKSGNTTAILFEGSVVFNKLPKKDRFNIDAYESIVDKGHRIRPGEFSVFNKKSSKPTKPKKLNKKQFHRMLKNKNFLVKKGQEMRTAVPTGLKNSAVALKEDTSSMIHLESGAVISTNTQDFQRLDESGEFLPPKGIVIQEDGAVYQKVAGKLNKISDSGSGKLELEEVKKKQIINKRTKNKLAGIPKPVGETYIPDTFFRSNPIEPTSSGTILKRKRRLTINVRPTDQ